jgi:hypothetical protein
MAARHGAPPFFSSMPATPEAAAAAPNNFGRVGAVNHRRGIRHGTWSPAALGLSTADL